MEPTNQSLGISLTTIKRLFEITDKYNKIGLKLAAQVAKIASLSIGEDNVTEIMKRTASGSKIMQPSFMCPILKT